MEVSVAMAKQPGEMRAEQAKKGNKIAATVVAKAATPVPIYNNIDRDIRTMLSQVAPTESSIARGKRCFATLQTLIHQNGGPAWGVYAFGSFANGFGTVSSDIDVTCCEAGHTLGAQTQQQAVLALTSWILPSLEQHPSFSIEEKILNARVPIVKLRFEKELAVDLSCHNPIPLRNTSLLKAYALIDPRVRDLGIAIKLWAKGSGLCDATKSNLSSYAFTLLCIYFMQVHPDVKLPVLPVDSFGGQGNEDAKISSARAAWRCTLSLSELLTRFFEFYSNSGPDSFQWGSEVVAVRLGYRLDCSAVEFSQMRGRHVHRLHIEDPYQLERNLHAPLGKVEEEQLCHAISEAFSDLKAQRTPFSLSQLSCAHHDNNGDVMNLIRKMKMIDQGEVASSDASTGSVSGNTTCSDDEATLGKGDAEVSSTSDDSSTCDGKDSEVRSSPTSRWNRHQGHGVTTHLYENDSPTVSDLQRLTRMLASEQRSR